VIWYAQSDHFRPLFCTALKSLTNYSAAMKSIIRKILYRCTSTITILTGCCRIFFILLLNGWSRAQTLCPSNFQKNSYSDLILKQMLRRLAAYLKFLLKVWKNISFSKEQWNLHQNWFTNGDNIASWMTKPLFQIQRMINKQKLFFLTPPCSGGSPPNFARR